MILTKDIFRKKCIKRLKTKGLSNKAYKNAILNHKLQMELKKLKFKTVLFYYPLPFEADIRKTLIEIRKKYDVFLPFMEGKSFKMVPCRLPFKKRKFGIFEAGNTKKNIKKIDVAIVPVIGVDVDLKRVGFGKGMYDRFFEKLKIRPYTIFVESEFCYTKSKICDSYDIWCDLFLTPRHRLVARGKGKKC